METDIQLPAGISLIPAVRKPIRSGDNDFNKKNPSGDSSSTNTDASVEELQLSPVKTVQKRKHIADIKPSKKYKNSTNDEDFHDSSDEDDESDFEENHDRFSEQEGSKEVPQDIPDILGKFGNVLQGNNVVLSKDDSAVLIKSSELDISKTGSKDLLSVGEDSDKLITSENEKNNDELEFDITEKLREMGEISVKPVKKGYGEQTTTKRNDTEDEVSVEIATKDGEDEEQCTAERKVGNLRRNIREVMDDQQLDAATLSAQREEMERLARVQEQQKMIREVQRQIALNRQNNKTQTRVLSLLQGNTSLLKQNSNYSGQKVGIPGNGTVLMKIPNKGVQRQGLNLTPSISIAPVKSSTKSTGYQSSDSEPEVDVKPIVFDHDIKKPKKDIVTIVDSSSDDDCIILSDDEEPEEEPEEDTQNSGLHVNDAYNTPDEQGRVVINIGHPEGDSDIFLAPQIARVIKPHQIGGVRFLFDNIIESVERFNSSTGFGCILAHSMGLGKTLQLVCFCDIFLRHTSSKTILCIMPINTLQNWMAEFNMWLPVDAETSPLRLHGEVRARNFNLHVLNDSHKTLTARAKVIQDWTRDGGVLLIGYELYRLLSLKKMCKPKKRRGKNQASLPEDPEDIESNKKLLDEMFSALVKPGPDLVICDEGHRIKNSHAGISMALKQIRSKRRIVLTGYPLQNNLQEYWCMVDFVRPNYLGTKTEFANMFERPIQNGQCIDSTPQDIKLMRYRAHVLHSLLLGFVQRRSHAVLQTSLPQKEEYVLMLRMTPFQRKLYDTFMNDVVRKKAVPNALKAFAVCCKIWNHPDVLYHWLRKREADLDLDLDDGSADTGPNTATNQTVSSVKPKKGGGRARAGTAKTTKKDKKLQKGVVADAVAQDAKPSASIIPNSINNSSNPESTSANSNSKFFMPNSDNSDNAISFSNMGNERNNQTFPPSRQMESGNYSYPYGYGSQNNYYPPKEEYRTPQYLQNQPSQFPSGDNYNAFQSQQPNTDAYSSNNSGQYWGQNYYMNQQSTDFNYPSNYSNNMFNYDNRYSEFDNIKTDDKNWNSMRFDNIKTEDNKTWNLDKQEQNQEVGDTNENCDTNMKLDKKNILDLNSDTSGVKSENRVNSLEEPNIKMPEDITMAKPIDENFDKTLDDVDIQSLKIPPKDEGIPYDWATELLKGYVDGVISNSAKMEIFFCILEESIKLNDRILVFSQSLFTLNLIEDFLQKNVVTGTDTKWAKNVNYYRLDGSTSALEREKLINEFNTNPHIHMFLVSTRAGSLGINLVGANRVIVFDASWNPCHDTQAVCRVYRYGQKKPCFVYRLVMDNCLERKIYDRQINKQGMADRVVDECNPDAHLSMKEVTNLCWDDEQDSEVSDFSHAKDKYIDVVMQKVVESFSHALNKEPFQHESLLIDRKEKKLSQAEKRQAQRGYELEKQASTRPAYSYNTGGGMQYRTIRTPDGAIVHRPVASVRPMQADMGERSMPPRSGGARPTRWIPAEVWQRQGMTAQEMTLPLDVVIPTSSTEKANIVLKAGQKVMVLKSPKGIYMQLESGKIIAIKTAFKVGQNNKSRGEGPADCLSNLNKKAMMRGNPSSKMPNSMIPGLSSNMRNNPMMHNRMSSKMNAARSSAMPMANMKENSRFNSQSAKIGGVMRKNIQFASAKPYNVQRNKPNLSGSKHAESYVPPKMSSTPTGIKIDDTEKIEAKSDKEISKPHSIFGDEEKSKESGNDMLDSIKELNTKETSLDCNDTKSNEFNSTLCLDDHESKNTWLTEDISKLKLDLESENAENTSSSNKSSNSGASNNLNLPLEELNSTLNEDTNDKTEKEFSDKGQSQQITSLKNYRHKSSHKPTSVSATISNINSQSIELEKTASSTNDPGNMFQPSSSETSKDDDNKSITDKPEVSFFNSNIDLSDKSDRSLEPTPTLDTNYPKMQIDNAKSLDNVDDKKKADLLGVGNQNFSAPFSYEKNNMIQESQEETAGGDRVQEAIPQQIHHFPSYGHSEPNVAPAQSYAAPYAGYSYPTNAVPPYDMYAPHSSQYHDPAYSGLFHGHSAFHRPEPISIPPGQEINSPSNFHQQLAPYQLPPGPPKPVSYPPLNSQTYPQQIQNYPPQPPIPTDPQSTSQKVASVHMQAQAAPPATSQMPPGHLSPNSQIPPAQMAPAQLEPQPYPNQNSIPNYQLNVPANGYGNYGNQPIYSQFSGNYPNPNPQSIYNSRIYPTMEYGTTNFSTGYGSSYPGQQANNQWAQ